LNGLGFFGPNLNQQNILRAGFCSQLLLPGVLTDYRSRLTSTSLGFMWD
jgi:hypothetical protein